MGKCGQPDRADRVSITRCESFNSGETNVFQRAASRRLQTVNIARSSRALLACAVSAGMTFQVATHPAKAEETVTAESYLADLVNQLSEAKGAVSRMELEMGGLREQANKARVDLAKAQDAAQKAQNQVVDARDRLSLSDDAVAKAQKELDQLARSTYNAGGDGSPINLAAGADAVSDTLDRSTMIRLAAQRQENTVDRLDLARTQTANEESSLRANRSAANDAVSAAVKAHQDANKALATAMEQLKEKSAELAELIKQQKTAQRKLDAARKAVNNVSKANPGASSWDKRRAAESAADKAEDSQAQDSAVDTQQSPAPGVSVADKTATSVPTDAASKTTGKQSTTAGTKDSTLTPAEQESPATGNAEAHKPDASNPLGTAPDVDTDFAADTSGDRERQLAINGLINAGNDAVMTGFSSYNEHGNQKRALKDAVAAGRDSAGREYDNAQAQLHPSAGASQNPTQGTGTGTSGTEAASGATSGAGASGGTKDGTATDSATTGTTGTTSGNNTTAGTNPVQDALDKTETGTAQGSASEQIEAVIARAMSQQGVPYAWGGGNYHGPTLGIRDYGVADAHGDYAKVGFDCSGLMMYAFYAVGIQLDHYSGSQYNAGRQVPASEMKRGDMLFWGANGSQHVALYLGNGKMLEAPQSGSYVQVSDVRWGGMAPYAVRMIE
ncbi:hypothetical protein GSS87_04005 [Corynebacterium sp. 4HC-13]|nr:hypothetical protein [Corynebacterium anserum]